MRIVVDMRLCELHGQCAYLAPEVFRLEDDTLAFVERPDPALRDKVERAAKACPQLAIRIVEDPS